MVVLVNKNRQKNIYFNLVFSEVYISDVFHSVFFSKVDRGSSTEGGISSFLHAHSALMLFSFAFSSIFF